MERNIYKIGKELFITSDEEIKEGDWYIYLGQINKRTRKNPKAEYSFPNYKKIILTTDPNLIKDGVQPIDDEFLEWFVKNPSCERVEFVDDIKYFNIDELRERFLNGLPHLYSEKKGYKIIIPKEEPKQDMTAVETLRKVINSYKSTGISSEQMIDELLKLIDSSSLEIEKQQIIESFENGIEEGIMRYSSEEYNLERYENAERYYNETFKNK